MRRDRFLSLLFAPMLSMLGACGSSQKAADVRPVPPTPPVSSAAAGVQVSGALESERKAGEDVVARLRARFDDPASSCQGSATAPAFLCSGVILRPSMVSDLRLHAWNPTSAEQASGGMVATFLRRDVGFAHLARGATHGLVLYPILATPAGKLRPQILCVFPSFARSEERDRPGCGRHPTYYQQTRYCQGQNILTAEAWVAHVRQAPGGDIPRYQCSFDVRDAAADTARIFAQVPLIRAMLGGQVFADPPELLVAAWPMDVSTQVPVEAVFYVAGSSGLAGARRDQEDFFRKSGGVVLPLIRITLPTSPGAGASFDFIPEDQVPLAHSGEWLANDLNARIASTVANCGTATRPAFLCSGVLLRATRAGNYHAWLPSPPSVANQGMPFTFIRHDFPVLHVYNPNGFIVYPPFGTPDTLESAVVRCIFPVDGWTGGRPGDACGPAPRYPEASKPCQDHVAPIETAQAWFAHFDNIVPDPEIPYADKHSHQCGFRLVTGTPRSAAIFLEAGKGTALTGMAHNLTRYNETVVQPWAKDIGPKVPVEAFFYLSGSNGLAVAQADQRDFLATLGIRVPIVRITIPVPAGGQAFEYDPADQAVPYP